MYVYGNYCLKLQVTNYGEDGRRIIVPTRKANNTCPVQAHLDGTVSARQITKGDEIS